MRGSNNHFPVEVEDSLHFRHLDATFSYSIAYSIELPHITLLPVRVIRVIVLVRPFPDVGPNLLGWYDVLRGATTGALMLPLHESRLQPNTIERNC